MTTIKVKLRKSRVDNKPGTLFIQLIHNREVKLITTRFKLHPSEWNDATESIVPAGDELERIVQLYAVQQALEADLLRLRDIIAQFELLGTYLVADVTKEFLRLGSRPSLAAFIQERIVELNNANKRRTAETYRSTLRVFMDFRQGGDLFFEQMDEAIIGEFERYLQSRKVMRNTSSFYMRILRCVYNKAVQQGVCVDCKPFRKVYTGIDKTVKRAVDECVLDKLTNYQSTNPGLQFARDMFLFSFYTRGMAFVDVFHLKKSNVVQDTLQYSRTKTGQPLSVRLEPCMTEIIDRYTETTGHRDRLFPFAESGAANGVHTSALRLQNQRLKIISQQLQLKTPLSSYVSRHTWASMAKRKGIATSVISECMGHSNEVTTRIYLASFEQNIIDKANLLVIHSKNKDANHKKASKLDQHLADKEVVAPNKKSRSPNETEFYHSYAKYAANILLFFNKISARR